MTHPTDGLPPANDQRKFLGFTADGRPALMTWDHSDRTWWCLMYDAAGAPYKARLGLNQPDDFIVSHIAVDDV